MASSKARNPKRRRRGLFEPTGAAGRLARHAAASTAPKVTRPSHRPPPSRGNTFASRGSTNGTAKRKRDTSRDTAADSDANSRSSKHQRYASALPNGTPTQALSSSRGDAGTTRNKVAPPVPVSDQNTSPSYTGEYVYTSTGPDSIRILIVHPGPSSDELDCSLTARPIRRLNAQGHPLEPTLKLPPYDALSYSWDNQNPAHGIRIRKDNGGFYIFDVTENLLAALQQLRHSTEPRRFWVDAICINQDDLIEKSHQLPLMSRIYSEADNVCVWLGAGCESSSLAFDLMEKMRILKDFDHVVERKTTCEEWMGLTALLKRNWFSRRWVVQEITLARRATIQCGSTTIAWRDFAEAVTLFEVMVERVTEKFRKDPNYGQHPNIFGDVSKFSANRLVSVTSNIVDKGDDGQVIQKTWTLESLVSALTPFQAGLSHDIVYAVLSLAKDVSGSSVSAPLDYTPNRGQVPKEILEGKSEDEVKKVLVLLGRVFRNFRVDKFPVNYEKPFNQVCMDFVKFTTAESNSLDIICRPWAPVGETGLPSWIRTLADSPFGRDSDGHWDRKNADTLVGLPGQSQYRASGKYRREWSFIQEQDSLVLKVRGFELDIVHEVEDAALSGVVPVSWLHYANLVNVQYDPCETSNGTSTVKESFWRTMVAGKGPDGQNPPPYYSFVCEKTFTTVIEHGGDVILGQIHDRSTNTLQRAFIKRAQSMVWGRRLTVTGNHKLLALVPHATKPKDLICILPGCSVPVVLRKPHVIADGKKNKEYYKFIGESYVHGMMAGEAFEKKNETKTEYDDFYII